MTPDGEPLVSTERPDPGEVVLLPDTPSTAPPVRISPDAIVRVGQGDGDSPTERRRPAVGRVRSTAKILAAGCVVLALAGGVVLRSPLFEVRSIRIQGAAHLSRADVLRLARISGSTNVATFDAGAAERRLEGDPWIEDATIAKHLPSTLVVVVRERQPLAVAEVAGALRLVASDGTALGVATPTALLPRIASADPTAPALTSAEVGDAARAIAAMPLGLRRTVAQVAVLGDGELRVDLTSGAQVLYGPTVELTAKAQALRALFAYAARRGMRIAAADVQVPTAPTARLVAGAPAAP